MHIQQNTAASIINKESRPLLPSAIFATFVFVLTELMFFAALVSAFTVLKAGAAAGQWTIPLNVQLPVLTTGFNTFVLLLSGVFIWLAGRRWSKDRKLAQGDLLKAIVLGAFFVGLQGYEWFNLIKWGTTIHTNLFFACFFLIIGCHALHAISAIVVMLVLYARSRLGKLTLTQLQAMQVFWYFVVGVWPVLYGLVYF